MSDGEDLSARKIGAGSEGSVFLAATFDEALTQAKARGVWLLVAATAASDEPARMMDRTTWRNDRVSAWIADNAIAIQIDVDAQRALAAKLRIDGVPSVLAFKDGKEKDRIAGFLESARLLMWLLSLDRDIKTIYDKAIREGGGDFERDMHGRLSFAKELLHDKDYVKATDHYVWLWHNMEQVDPAMGGVRVSFMAGEIKTLVDAFAPARDAFAAIRDDAGAAADRDPTSEGKRLDWVVLNNILGDPARTLAWFDGVKADPGAEAVVRGVGRFLIEVLKARGRWADVGRLYRDPLKELAFHHQLVAQANLPMMAGVLPEGALATVEKVMHAQFRRSAAELHTSLRAAGRAAEADAVHGEALRLDPSDEMKRALAGEPIGHDAD
jgi:thioredoxin